MLKISISNQSSFYKAEIVNKMVYNFYIKKVYNGC